jgi:molecular chaperone GrpE
MREERKKRLKKSVKPKGREERRADRDYQQLEADLKKLQLEVKAKEAQAGEYLELLKRVKADFDNYRKRMLREQTRLTELAAESLISKLLPLADNLERALQAAEKNSDFKSLKDGVRIVYEQLQKIFEEENVKVIDPQGDIFDPNCHEAVVQEVSEDFEDETVLEVMQKGYMMKGKLLRPAMVKVCRRPKEKESLSSEES